MEDIQQINLPSRLPIDPPQEENDQNISSLGSKNQKVSKVAPKEPKHTKSELEKPEHIEVRLEEDEHIEQEDDFESLDVANFQTVDDPLRRRQLIRKIADYKSRFGEYLVDILPKDLNLRDQSVYDLEIMKDDCVYMVENRSATKMGKATFLAGTSILEVSSGVFGLQLQGLTTHVSKNEALLQCLDEISLKQEPVASDPITRLGLIMAQTCFALDQANRHGNIPSPMDKKREELLKDLA